MRHFILALMLLAPSLARAEEELALDYALEMGRGNAGKLRLFLGKDGVRMELDMSARGFNMSHAVITQKKAPNTSYQLDDAKKTYREVTLDAERTTPAKTYAVKKIGEEIVAGYKAVHVVAKDPEGLNIDLWSTKELSADRNVYRALQRGARLDGGLQKALEDAGVAGLLVKAAYVREDASMTMTLVKAEKKKLDPTLFTVPTSYTKQDAKQPSVAGVEDLPPELQEKIRERMKQASQEP